MDGGRGLTFTEFDVAPDVIGELGQWHGGEHVPERLAIPGVRSARRYLSETEPRHYCAFYRADEISVFAGPAYQALFANQSEATMRITAGVKGTRFVGTIEREEGVGFGGLLHRFRVPLEPDRDAEVTAWYDAHARDLLARPGVVRLMLASPRRDLANVSDPNWLFFAEGFDSAALEAAGEALSFPGVTGHSFRLEHLFG